MPFVFEDSGNAAINKRFVFEDEPKERFAFEEDQPSKTMEAIKKEAKGAYRTIENIGSVYPVLEAGANIATQTYGLPLSGLAGLAGLSFGKGEEWQNKVAGKLIYQPQTDRGKELTESAFYPFTELEKGAEKAGEATLEKTGSPALATVAHTAIMGAPMLLPGGKLLKKWKAKGKFIEPSTIKETPVTKLAREEFKERFVFEEAKGVPEAQAITETTPKPPRRPPTKGEENAVRIWEEEQGLRPKTEEGLTDTIKPESEKGTTLYSGFPITKAAEAWTKDVGSPVWDTAIQKKVPKLLEKIPGGKTINRALIYDYRGNLPNTETYIKSMEDMKRFQSVGREYAVDLGKRLQSFDEATQLKIGEYITTKEPTVALEGKVLEYANEAKQVMLDLGRQAVDAGLLSEDTFFKNAGQYMPRLYTSKEYQSLLTKFNITKPNRLDLSRFKKRKDIPKEIREQMGEILTPGYPIAKGIVQLTHDIEQAKFFTGISTVKEWAIPKGLKDTPIPEGFKKLPANKKLGKLSEAYVHPEIFADLQETIHVMSQGERVWRKALGSWKFGKVILSPKTHMRNLMSNSVLAHLGGLPMYEQPVYLTKAAKAMKQKGELWTAAKKEGLLRDTFTNAELRTLFDQVEGNMRGVKASSIPEKLGAIGSAWEKSKTQMNKAAKLYEAEEQWFKMAKFIHNVERKGMNFRMAAKDAEKWLFNYSKLTKFQEKYRSKWYGAPFATFTFKALPRISEAMIKTPWRFALPTSMIYALERAAQNMIGDTKEEIKAKKELRPDWMKGSFMGIPNFARMPFVDENGREYYLNLTYILPWGDIGEGGGFGPIPGSLRPFSQPFVNEPVSQIFNYDPFWKQNIVKEEDVAGKTGLGKLTTEAKIRGGHLVRSFAPTPTMDIEKGISSLRREPDYKGRLRPSGVIAADALAGVKMYAVDYVERTAQEIAKLDPQKGYLARKIKGEIETLHIKKQAMIKSGGDEAYYDKKIEEKINQLKGLAKEARKVGILHKTIKKKK